MSRSIRRRARLKKVRRREKRRRQQAAVVEPKRDCRLEVESADYYDPPVDLDSTVPVVDEDDDAVQ